MGFNSTGMGPMDLQIVRSLQPEIIAVLRKAATKITQGGGRPESRKWFGDDSNIWMAEVAQKLNLMASFINTKEIDIGFSDLPSRCSSEFARANMPVGGWDDFANQANPMTAAQGRNFRIFLNHSWNAAPLYRPFKRPADSKFQTLVHECTHLFINTDDDAYGVPTCEITAARNPNTAKKTADCWGYFVEEFR
jgi:Lysine-specific metallo-endopeptidase